jgi:hypothetical protein
MILFHKRIQFKGYVTNFRKSYDIGFLLMNKEKSITPVSCCKPSVWSRSRLRRINPVRFLEFGKGDVVWSGREKAAGEWLQNKSSASSFRDGPKTPRPDLLESFKA